jgi:hypothetical protein
MPGWMRGFSPLLLCGIILFFHANAQAAEVVDVGAAGTVEKSAGQPAAVQPSADLPAADQPVAEQPAATVPEAGILAAIDGPRDYLSGKIVSYSKSIDEFFGDPRYFQENNKSVIQFDLSETLTQGGNKNFLFEGKAKLDFPAAQRRFQLVLESNPEQKTAKEIQKDQPTVPQQSAKPEQYAASVRYEKSEEGFWHFSADSGAQFQFPLDPFIRTRGSYSVPVADWRLKLAETLFWFNTSGLGETTQFDMEHVLSEPVLFRATSTVTCMESPQICDLRQDLSVFHTLNERTALLYQASVIGANKPVLQENVYVLLVKYRYRLHREWVFFEVSPQIFFPRTDYFNLNAQLVFRLEILFGGTK